MLKNILLRYTIYIIYFLGIGMVSSGIVLMPFNPTRYGTIFAIGLILFTTGSVINETILEKRKMSNFESIKLIIVSLFLAIGIGMISGGIAHFKESPVYVTYLIPLGLIISFVSFVIKNRYSFTFRETTIAGISLILLAIVLHTGLAATAEMMGFVETGGDVFKGHSM